MVQIAYAQSLDTLKKSIERQFSSVPGTFALAMKVLPAGAALMINEHEVFHAASTMKVPVMIEVFKQAAEGRLALGDSVAVKNEFTSIVDRSPYQLDLRDDSDSAVYRLAGSKASVRDLVYHMITTSSNLATNVLLGIVGAKNVTATMRGLGANDIQILRGVEDGKAFAQGLNNTTTAYDLTVIFEALAEGKVVDKTSCDAMVNILLDQKFQDKIPALLPPEVKVANKTGNITGVEHDAALIMLPEGQAPTGQAGLAGRRYILVVLSKNLKDANAGKQAIARASKTIFDFITQTR